MTVRGRPKTVRTERDGSRGAGGDLADQIAKVARGDTDAFDAVYDQVAPAVYGTVRRVLRDPLQSEEVAQEVLLDIWRCASRFEAGMGSPNAWIATIAHRRAVDRVRSNQRSAERDQKVSPPAVNYNEVAEAVEIGLDHQRVRRCLATLTETQRESIVLAYYGGYSYSEVAGLLKLPLGTVKTRMRDALIRLRDCLEIEQ